jgi:hypothetical protein
MFAISTTGLAVTLLAFFLCGMLLMLCIWLQKRSIQLMTQHEQYPHMVRKNFYTHSTSGSSHQSDGLCSAATVTTPNHNDWTAQITTGHNLTPSVLRVNQDEDVLATIRPARLANCRQENTNFGLFSDERSVSISGYERARGLDLDLERGWLQPLSPTWSEREGLLEQQLWRNSSGGSSCYSHPSSWYGSANAEEVQARPQLEPTTQAGQLVPCMNKALPPVPI